MSYHYSSFSILKQQIASKSICNKLFLKFKMKVGVFLAFLIFTTQSATYFRLNTNENTKLNPGDTLISTMGLYSATLLQNLCVLSISTFNGNNGYTKVGNYTSPNVTGNCNYLTIIDGQIVTDNNSTYMYVGPTYNLSTIFTIDDYGIMRLIGTYQLPDYQNQVSQVFNVTGDYVKNQTFIFPTDNIIIGFINSFPTVNNLNKWQFSASLGQLDISQYDNSGIIISYSYANIKILNSQIQDFNDNTFPSAIFPNISFYPRCYQPRLYLNFKPPFVLVFDPYWPKASVYQQGRYKILEVSYSKVYQPYAWQQDRRLFSRNQPSVCPPFTFQFKGNCTPICPYPYYYELRGENGYCVLTCQQYTPKNETTRICSCHSNYEQLPLSINTIRACPENSTSYPYGCYCNDSNLYFDRLFTLTCVATCPNTTFASNGLCMNCPPQCLTCQIDGLFRAYLQCKVCKTGYTLTKGQCYSSCSPGKGLSLVQGICATCSDPNCLNCSSNVAVCTRCSPLFAVSNGSCLQTCDNSSFLAYYDKISSVCLPRDSACLKIIPTFYKTTPMLKCYKCQTGLISHLNKCVNSCPVNFTANSNNFCYCSTPGKLLVNDQCLQIPTCPMRMGWDPISFSCLACSFGCLSCYDLECTSCVPGYFLYISPQGVRCRKKSPLFPCDQQYSWINGACLLNLYSNPLYRLTKCLSSITNCMACLPNSDTDCSICNSGFYNVNNTCLSTCPNGTIPYQGLTCVLAQIVNCSLPYLQFKYQAFILNYDKITNSDPYLQYIFNGSEWSNDPVGYIPRYQNLTLRTTDGMFRDTQFYYPAWTCLKCNDGYGMSSNFSSCLPCPSPCLTCYMALNNSCLTLKSVAPTGCQYYIDYNTKECVKNCSQYNVIPYVENGVLYCYPISKAPIKTASVIDSSAFTAADGSTNVFFVLDHPLTSGQNVPLKISTNNQAKLLLGSNETSSPPKDTKNVVLNSAGYVFFNDPNPDNNVWILDASGNIQNTVGSSGITLSNSQYGIKLNHGYNNFRKTWLAYIGYIMGIVLICLHVVYIGNDLIYKVDNTLILAQSIYFFSFVQLLVGKLLSQFYYGWLFSHFGFFPNFFIDYIPSNYMEVSAPNSYKLNSGDANIVRNAGWAFSLLLVFLAVYGVVTFLCWLIKSICHKPDVWHPRIAINSLIGFVEFISFTIFYWAIANLLYIGDSDLMSPSFNKSSKSVSIFFVVLITLYSLFRWFFNPLGGLYMIKRILIATILAASYTNDKMVAPIVLLEVVFFIFRFILEKPDKNRLIIMIVLESLLHIATYLLLYLILDAGTNTIIISIIIFIMIVVLSYGLTNLYLESQNEWQVQEKEEESEESIARAQADKKVSKIQKY